MSWKIILGLWVAPSAILLLASAAWYWLRGGDDD